MMKATNQPAISALFEILLLFMPALPAYLWLWPNVPGTGWYKVVQTFTYLYFLAGSILIGRRHWSLDQLGINRRGVGLSLLFGSFFILGRTLAYISTNLPLEWKFFSLTRLGEEILFYFFLVGFVEELLFRGLIYCTLEQLKGVRLAIWGSALMFGTYHIGSQGALGALGTSIIGLIFAVIRWRAGGILGLAFIHGLIDLIAAETQLNFELAQIEQIQIEEPILLTVSYVFLFGPMICLWKGHRPGVKMRGL